MLVPGLYPDAWRGRTYHKNGIVTNGDGRIIRHFFIDYKDTPALGGRHVSYSWPWDFPTLPGHFNTNIRIKFQYNNQIAPNHSGSAFLLGANNELFLYGALQAVSSNSSGNIGVSLPPTTYYINQINQTLGADGQRLAGIARIVE
jgi:hypothetical protein